MFHAMVLDKVSWLQTLTVINIVTRLSDVWSSNEVVKGIEALWLC